jgi:hypothetical protein
MIATNAQAIIDARVKGLRPADMVIVSMIGTVKTDNPLVHAKPGVAYDWRWVRDLNVCLYVSGTEDWPLTLRDIGLQHPRHMELWNNVELWGAHAYLIPTAHDIERPVRQWKFEIDFLPWMDFQNRDFIERRAYERDHNGVPYAVGS